MPVMLRRGPRVLLAALLAVVAVLGLAGCGKSATATATSAVAGDAATGARPSADAAAVGTASNPALAPASPTTDLRTVKVAALPPEAVTTLQLIAAGGPYPYSKDGATFGNRERILPSRPNGFYQEYTVVTPGESDRGARRIVAGKDGSRFYTADHYASFREVVQ